eukprot:1973404-Alexandrium_andersonii.AAC.1
MHVPPAYRERRLRPVLRAVAALAGSGHCQRALSRPAGKHFLLLRLGAVPSGVPGHIGAEM